MAIPEPAPETADGEKIPPRLTLAFSRAADVARIGKLFNPAIKSKIDPRAFVVRREKAAFEAAIGSGRAAFLYDTASGEVFAVTMAYHVEDATGRHRHTEIGTSMSRLPGYKAAQLVVAAMVLKEWWTSPPAGMVATEILPDNVPSLKVYRDRLGWEAVKDPAKMAELHRLCNAFISAEDKGRQTIWFSCTASVLPKMARVLLDAMDDPSLRNKHTGHAVDLDLGALAGAGLTRARLEAIARGITDKRQLQAKDGGPAPHP